MVENLTSQNPLLNTDKLPGGVKKNLPKLIFLILGIVIAVELIYVVKALREAPPTPPQTSQIKPLSGASIILVSNKKEYKVGENIDIQVRLDTGGKPTAGTDLILKYDPNLIEASKSAISVGKVYPEYPLTEVDQKTGTIRVSGIASAGGKGFNGVGLFTNLTLLAKRSGDSFISVEFKDGSTTESNVSENNDGTDILENVSDLTVNIK